MINRYVFLSLCTRYVWLLGLTFLLCGSALAQETRYTLKGRVTDASSAGIPGVTVVLRGSSQGTVSVADGTYSLGVSVPPDSYTLAFSSIGYTAINQLVSLGSQETVTTDVTLTENNQTLDEVVIIGSTPSAPKRELGNAISTIKAQALDQSGSGELLNSLQGKVPGAQITQNSGDPAGGISVRLRGIKSLSGSSDPLFVIDGVIVSNVSQNVSQLAVGGQVGIANADTNRLSDINPAHIASINVINGAAAAAQYGSRASNGVVLITTRRGQMGAPRVTFTASASVNELRKSVPLGTYNKQFGFPGLRLHPIAAVSDADLVPDLTTGRPRYVSQPGETLTRIVQNGVGNNLRTNLVDVTRYNYFDQIFRTGYGTDNTVSVAGGRENTSYYVSFGYLKNEGILKNTNFSRYNLRARLDQRLTNWAKLSVGLSYVNSFANEKANGNVFYSPINSVSITNNIYDITQRSLAGNLQAVEPSRVNPLSTIEDMNFTQAVSRIINDVQLNLTPLRGLSIDAILGVDTYG